MIISFINATCPIFKCRTFKEVVAIGVGEGEAGEGGTCPPLKFGKTITSGNYHVKFLHFSGIYRAKFGNFVDFSGKNHKESGILIIFRARIV